MVDREYFYDRGDKFDPGKGTGVYYWEPHYFILHSSYVNGNTSDQWKLNSSGSILSTGAKQGLPTSTDDPGYDETPDAPSGGNDIRVFSFVDAIIQ